MTADGGIINVCLSSEGKYKANKHTKMALTTIIHLSLHMLMDGEVTVTFGQLPVSALGSHAMPYRLINHSTEEPEINHRSMSQRSERETLKSLSLNVSSDIQTCHLLYFFYIKSFISRFLISIRHWYIFIFSSVNGIYPNWSIRNVCLFYF